MKVSKCIRKMYDGSPIEIGTGYSVKRIFNDKKELVQYTTSGSQVTPSAPSGTKLSIYVNKEDSGTTEEADVETKVDRIGDAGVVELVSQYASRAAALGGRHRFAACKTGQEMLAIDPDVFCEYKEYEWSAEEVYFTGFSPNDQPSVFDLNLMSLEVVPAQINCNEFKGNITSTEVAFTVFMNGTLNRFDSTIPKMYNGKSMFSYCAQMTSFKSDIPTLENGEGMFSGCTNLTSFENDLPALIYGTDMFYNSGLVNWNVDLPALTNGGSMFSNCGGLTSFTSDMPKLTDGNNMFNYCTNLTSFDGDLPIMVYGYGMFYYCTNLTSFKSDLPKMDSGGGMFDNCASLTSFTGDLSSLTTGVNMFYYCSSLTSFNPFGSGEEKSGNLYDGANMFHKCKLDISSVKRIATWLPARSYKSGSEYSGGWIHIGVTEETKNNPEFDTAVAAMNSKNWVVAVCVNGSHTNRT